MRVGFDLRNAPLRVGRRWSLRSWRPSWLSISPRPSRADLRFRITNLKNGASIEALSTDLEMEPSGHLSITITNPDAIDE